jgi:hypothetical protein
MYNLFICYTPFHINIAHSIIQETNIKNNVLLYYSSTISIKNIYYYDKAKRYFNLCYKINIRLNPVFDWLKIKKFSFKYRIVNQIYVGNLKTLYTRFLLSQIHFKKLNTFDDGVGHFYKSKYFTDYRESFLSKCILRRKKYTYKNLDESKKLHFTICKTNKRYKNKFIEYNSVIDTSKLRIYKKCCTIFLSRPFSEDKFLNYKEETNIYNYIIDKTNPEYIQLHPRETSNKTSLKEFSKILLTEDIIKFCNIKTITGVSSTTMVLAKIINPKLNCIFYALSYNEALIQLLKQYSIEVRYV